MVNFRFHLVSIIAIFLALAIGIGMGVTVIDKATVDFLKKRLDAVSSDVDNANRRSNDLQRQIERDGSYQSRAEDFLIDKKLANVSVTMIAFRGIDQAPLNDTRHMLSKAGAGVNGTLWFPAQDSLDQPKDAAQLQQLLGAATSDPSALRESLVTRVAAVMAGTNDGGGMKQLVDSGFLEWESDQGPADVAQVSFATSRLVLVSAFNASVPNDQLAIPLTRLLAAQPAKRLVAGEVGREPDDKTSGERAIFLQPLRGDGSLNTRFSTVDDLETDPGRVAVVLALAQLADGRVGHYGLASSAEGPIPKLAS